MFLEKKKIYNLILLASLVVSQASFAQEEEKITDEMLEQEIAAALNPEAAKKEISSKKNTTKQSKKKETMVYDNAPRDEMSQEGAVPQVKQQRIELLSEEPTKIRISETKKMTEKEKKFLYSPGNSESQIEKHDGFVVERDSAKIIKKKIAINDTLNIKLCYSAGASLILDEDVQTEFQRVLLDDKMFFDAIEYENHRGVYVRLKQPIDDGKFWESAIRLVRKDNDKEYVINLVGVSCPKGMNPYPKVYYLQDKYPLITGKTTKVNTPEDTLIELSNGYPRKNVNKTEIYDLIARSGGDWAVVGLQLDLNSGSSVSNEGPFTFKVIDNLQISEIPTKVEYMALQSKKASEALDKNIARFKLTVNVNKQYFTENRYFYIMVINNKDEYHQYIKVDTLPYILSLRKRGFDI